MQYIDVKECIEIGVVLLLRPVMRVWSEKIEIELKGLKKEYVWIVCVIIKK